MLVHPPPPRTSPANGTGLQGWPSLGMLVHLHPVPPAGGTAAAGDCSGSRTVAHVAELPPPGQVAEGPGEVPGEDHQATPRLSPVAHHRPHQGLPHWNPAEVLKGLPWG